MPYIDATLMAVPTVEKNAYLAHVRDIDAIIMESGAIGVVTGWGDDTPLQTGAGFRPAVQATAAETVVLGWVIWPDRVTRDAGWALLALDERMSAVRRPYDTTRMIVGGFEVVEAV